MVVVALVGAVAALVCGTLIGLLLAQRGGRAAPVITEPARPLSALVVEALNHGVVVVDRDERVVLVNSSARGMGVLLAGRLAFDELVRLIRTSTDTSSVVHGAVDLPMGRLGREPIALSATAVPLPHPAHGDRVEAVALLLEDVTETRRLEAVRRDFVANVSHELKTPVGALTLLAEALQDASDDPEAVQRFAARMQHEGARLGRLVRELIELSRLQGAEPLPGGDAVSVASVLTEAQDRTRLVADQAGISIVTRCADDLIVRGNEGQLATAVANLLDNAVVYSPRGTRVALSARRVDEPDGRRWVEISVSDQGIGLAETELTRVFERFYRVDPARSRATGGTGLGLAIVKHVATNHGGTVSVWSAEGAGSTFTMRLPLVHSLAESATENGAAGVAAQLPRAAAGSG
ncbi:MAG: ATP-binding protein [Actinomycetota bacterium]